MKQTRKGRYAKPVSKTGGFKRNLNRKYVWFKKLPRWKKFALIFGPILLVLIIIPIVTYLYLVGDIRDQERLMNRNNTGIVFKDIRGETFYSIGKAETSDLVKLDDISDDLEHALVASEDKGFYEHRGFSVLSIGRAAITGYGGGSTISQQLAKNTLLSSDRNLLRKYQELFMSIAIEQNYSKDEILAMYLNSVFYGENSFGIKDAAETYFNKKPSQLNLAESAMLIGVLPAPSAYSPISGNSEYAKERQRTVLNRMVDNDMITAEQADTAASQELKYADQKEKVSIAPHFAEVAIEQLSERYGYERVMRSGYQVKTTLDADLQKTLNKNVAANMANIQAGGGTNASAIAIDPKSGEVRGLVGSADYNNKKWGKVDMTSSPRQPGSSFKPIYYSGALAEGVITPATVLHDKPINIDGYQPMNADRQFRGDITVRSALNQSLNIPSIEVMQDYGVNRSIEFAKELGVTTLDKNGDYGLSLALGAAEVPLDEMTNAYAAFANQGEQFKNTYITGVKDKFGKQIFAQDTKSKRVISQAGAFLISDILSDNAARAPMFGSALTVPGKTVAVKTGTTDDNRDAWTIGYSTNLAIGVWVGNNNNDPMLNGGSGMAGPIWLNTMTEALASKPDQKFVQPGGVVERATCYSNFGIATNDINVGTFGEYYLSSALPTKTCTPKKPQPIEVCVLDGKQLKTIDKEDFDSKLHSRDLDRCKEEEAKTIEVCELATGEVVTIDQKEFDPALYSRDTENCSPPDDEGDTSTDPPTGPGGPITPPPSN